MSADAIKKRVDWIIYGLMYLMISLPILAPFSPPLTVGDKARAFYALVDGLPANPKVLMVYDYGPDSYPLYQGLQEAFLKQVFSKGARVVVVSFSTSGPMMFQRMLGTGKEIWAPRKYGVDYANLGYIAGGETAVASFLANIRGALSTDFQGNRLETLPIMANINTAKDFDLVFACETETTLGYGWIRQVSTAFGIKLALITPTGQLMEPYYPAQIQGLLYPLPKAAAEYETLLRTPGNASSQLAISFVGCLFYALLMFGNVGKLFTRGRETKK